MDWKRLFTIKTQFIVFFCAWTGLILLLSLGRYGFLRERILELARSYAAVTAISDASFAIWLSRSGGAFVPADSPAALASPPGEASLRAADGEPLVRIVPAALLRQVEAVKREHADLHGRVVSLTPLNPANSPDPWEKRRLYDLANGADELSEVAMIDGSPHMRFIKALKTEASCLACHPAAENSADGLRGALSVSLPMAPYEAALGGLFVSSLGWLGSVWLAGVFFLVFYHLMLRQNAQAAQILEKRLTEGEARYRLAQRAAGAASWEWDVGEGRMHWCENASTLLGLSPLDLPRSHDAFLEMIHEDDRGRVADIVGRRLEHGGKYRAEYRIVRPDGSAAWLSASGEAATAEDGKVAKLYGVFRDVTERKDLERFKEDVDKIMRHDLKTPLNAVMGIPQLLEMDANLTEEQREFVALIRKAGQRATRQINFSLDVLKIETGGFRPRIEDFDLLEVLREIETDLDALIRSKSLGLVIDAPGPRFPMRADPDLCFSIFSNALANAAEASPENATISVGLSRGEGERVIEVANPGRLSETVLERFFEKYFTHGKDRGTGLGAYAIRIMTEVQGGRATVENAPGDRVLLRVFLPERE